MPAGLEVYRQNGTTRFSLNTRPINLLGVVSDTGIVNGSRTIVGLTGNGNPNFFPQPLSDFNERIPTITITGNVLTWTFKTSGASNNCRFRILYGEW